MIQALLDENIHTILSITAARHVCPAGNQPYSKTDTANQIKINKSFNNLYTLQTSKMMETDKQQINRMTKLA